MMGTNVYDKMKELGVTLPPAPKDAPGFVTVRPFGGNLLYVSGMGSTIEGQKPILGRIPGTVPVEDGQAAARNCALNALSALHNHLGDLNKIKSFVKLLCFVSSDAGFTEQHIVANGATSLLIDLFGVEVGKGARSAVGMAGLPMDFPVEVEMLVEIEG